MGGLVNWEKHEQTDSNVIFVFLQTMLLTQLMSFSMFNYQAEYKQSK